MYIFFTEYNTGISRMFPTCEIANIHAFVSTIISIELKNGKKYKTQSCIFK